MSNILRGWATWKDGKPHDLSLHTTRKSILIGYDMIPLMGLRKMKRRLESQGIFIKRTLVSSCSLHDRCGFCVSVGGVLNRYSMEWSINHTGGGVWKVQDDRGEMRLCYWSMLFFAESNLPMPAEHKHILGSFYMLDRDYRNPDAPRRKRDRKIFEELRKKAANILEQHDIRLQPVSFSQEGADD
jgi:hypothetical protein